MCTKSKQKRTGARGTHAGFPNVMMKQAGRTLTSRAGWLVSNFARLAFETSKIRSLDRTDENSRERTRGRSGGRRSRIEGTGNCAAQLSAYHGVARLIKVCCYAVVNLAEGGEREGKGGEKRRWLILREHFVRLENWTWFQVRYISPSYCI